METRTDPHSPTNLITEDYEYIFTEANHIPDMPGWVLRRGDFGLEMSRWIGRTDHLERGTDQCHHCGARLNYFAVLKHLPTGDAIVVGETCLENRFERATADFRELRKAGKLGREAAQVRQARKDFLTCLPEELEWLDNDEPHELVADVAFVRDVQAKFHRYGKLSENQIKAVLRIWEQANNPTPEPEEPAWVDTATNGRHVVTGHVLYTRHEEGDWGANLKVLLQVEDERGPWKLWFNCPQDLWAIRWGPRLVNGQCRQEGFAGPVKGDRFTMRITTKRSDKDSAFAFGSRPAKVQADLSEIPCGEAMTHVYGNCGCDTA